MNRYRKTALWLAPFISVTHAAAQAPISAACSSADAAVIGTFHLGPGAAFTDITITGVLKGPVTANSRLNAEPPKFFVDRVGSDQELTAVVFLKHDTAGWHVISPAGENAPLEDVLLPAGNTTPAPGQAAGACEDQAFLRALVALDDGNVAWRRLPVLAWFHGFDSEVYRTQLGLLSQSASPDFRAMGLEGRFSLGDVAALRQLQADAPTFSLTTLAELGPVLGSYRNPDSAGIAALGNIAGLADAKYAPLVYGAAQALHALHTLDSLPILYQLLDSPNPDVSTEAMFGFAAFVANFPIQTPDGSPSNRNITPLPGGKYTTGDGQSHFPIHGGDNQDTLAFWKAWYKSNFLDPH